MSEAPKLLCVPPNMVRQLWPFVLPYLARAYEAFDEFVPPDLQDWLADLKGTLWIELRGDKEIVAAMTVSLERKPSGLVCRMVAAGGEALETWQDHETRIVEYARAEGCVKITLEGRPAWSRILPGYIVTRVFMEKAI